MGEKTAGATHPHQPAQPVVPPHLHHPHQRRALSPSPPAPYHSPHVKLRLRLRPRRGARSSIPAPGGGGGGEVVDDAGEQVRLGLAERHLVAERERERVRVQMVFTTSRIPPPNEKERAGGVG